MCLCKALIQIIIKPHSIRSGDKRQDKDNIYFESARHILRAYTINIICSKELLNGINLIHTRIAQSGQYFVAPCLDYVVFIDTFCQSVPTRLKRC